MKIIKSEAFVELTFDEQAEFVSNLVYHDKGIISGHPGATVTNNICVAVEQAAWLRGPLTESNNLFWGGRVVFA
jgi:hypothetical protein